MRRKIEVLYNSLPASLAVEDADSAIDNAKAVANFLQEAMQQTNQNAIDNPELWKRGACLVGYLLQDLLDIAQGESPIPCGSIIDHNLPTLAELVEAGYSTIKQSNTSTEA